MKQHNVQQGTPEWHALRDQHFSASDAPAMMGASKYTSRDELIKQYATGIKPEVTPQQQRLFDKGHAAEAASRPIVEELIDDELFPVTVTDDTGTYLASLDGMTMLGELVFEHKLYSKSLAEQVRAEDLEMHYIWQLEQQAMITGCTQILFMTSDGTEENCAHFMYTPEPLLQERLRNGWTQFAADVEAYKAKLAAGDVEQPKQVESEAIKELPAVTYKMDGLALSSNLKAFESQALALIEKSKQPLETDNDFATAETLVKVFKSAEDKLASIAEQVLGEVQDIDQFTKDLRHIQEQMRQARLATDKQVKAEKDRRRIEIINKAQHDLSNHIQAQQAKLDGYSLPQYKADFAGAMKGRKTIESLQSAANDELARAKIDISQQADEGAANLKVFNELAGDHKMLFADLQQHLFKPADDFVAMVKLRIAEHKAAEEKRLEIERERIRQEEAKKLEAKQSPVVDTEKPEPIKSSKPGNAQEFHPLEWSVGLRHSEDIEAAKAIFGEEEFGEMAHDIKGNEYELQLTIKRVAIKKAAAA